MPVGVDPNEGLLSNSCQIARLGAGVMNRGSPNANIFTKSSDTPVSIMYDRLYIIRYNL